MTPVGRSAVPADSAGTALIMDGKDGHLVVRLGGSVMPYPRAAAVGSLSGFAATALRVPYTCWARQQLYRSAIAAAPARRAGPSTVRDRSRLLAAASLEDKSSRGSDTAVFLEALKKAGGGGAAGAAATVANVTGFMWLHTTVNFQYRHGMSTGAAMRHLYRAGGGGLGGLRRFYRGYSWALAQAPLARFGDTAANAGMLALLDNLDSTRDLPVWIKTGAASVAAGGFRILLMPIDACETMMQVEGKGGLDVLRKKVAAHGTRMLYAGALGAAGATLVGHYPWYLVYNTLNERLPQYNPQSSLGLYLGRSAVIGFCASALSDTVSNSVRVLKTIKQASPGAVSYRQAAAGVIAADGVRGLFLRGLKTRILANGLQSMTFTILWRMGQDAFNGRTSHKEQQRMSGVVEEQQQGVR